MSVHVTKGLYAHGTTDSPSKMVVAVSAAVSTA